MRILTILILLGLLIGCGGAQQAERAETGNDSKTGTNIAAGSDATNAASAANRGGVIDKSDPGWKSKVTEPGMMDFEAGKQYFWVLETNHGTMTFRLFHSESPAHVNSTIYLTEIGFYDDVIFHRVIPGFMAQGGDPTGTGRGGAGYRYDGEFSAGLSHTKPGLLSMANAGPGTDSSQFFITFVPTSFLDGKHTIFGELSSGTEVLGALEARGSRSGRTSELLKIIRATILIKDA